MSDTPQGPGWWQASDDKWYPPPRPAMPGEAPTAPTAPPTAVAPGPYGAPGAVVPPGPPVGPPTGPPSGGFPAGPPTSMPGGPMPGAPSPYGGMPPAMPGGSGANRTPLFVILGVLATAAVVALFFLMSDGGDDDPASPTTSQTPTTDGPDDPTTTSGPDEPTGDGPVQLVDSGFSNFTDSSDEPTAAYGFVVHNTSDDILQSVEIQVVAYAANDKVITTKDFSIGTIRPDEKLGMGNELWGENLQGGLERIEVQISNNPDSVVDPAEIPDGAFEIGEVTTTADDYNMTTTFHATWTYAAELNIYPSAYALFRDAEGKIVGGSYGSAAPEEGATEADVELTTYDVIPDVETTEVYLEPGWVYQP